MTLENVRKYVYAVLVALAPVVVYYGLAVDSEVALWIAVAEVVLGSGLATLNTGNKSVVVEDRHVRETLGSGE
jgi:hypothetical protein